MKRVLIIILFMLVGAPCFAIIIAGNLGGSGGSSAEVEPTAAAYWKFEDSSWDDEETALRLVPVNTPTFDSVSPIVGSHSASFAAASYEHAYVIYYNLPVGFPGTGTSYRTMSVCAAFNIASTGSADYLMGKYDTDDHKRSWAILKGSDDKFKIYHGDGGTSYEPSDASDTALSSGVDYKMCYTEDGVTAEYTLDIYNMDTSSAVGAQLSGTWSNVMPIKSVNLDIGGRWGSNDTWNGEIDEVKFYNDVLTSGQITAYFEGDFTY